MLIRRIKILFMSVVLIFSLTILMMSRANLLFAETVNPNHQQKLFSVERHSPHFITQFRLNPYEPVRSLGRGITTTDHNGQTLVLQLSCSKKDGKTEDQSLFSACEEFGYIFKNLTTHEQSYFNIGVFIPQNVNLKVWMKRNFKKVIPVIRHNISAMDIAKVATLLPGMALTLTAEMDDDISEKEGLHIGLCALGVGLMVAGGVIALVDATFAIKNSFFKYNGLPSEFMNKEKQSWQFNSRKVSQKMFLTILTSLSSDR